MLGSAVFILVLQSMVYILHGQQDVPQDVFDKIFGKPPQDDCECVQWDQCENGTIKTDGADTIDIRIPSPCRTVLELCCKKPFEISETTPPITTVTTETPVTIKPSYQWPGKCGQRNFNGVGFRITTPNHEAQFGEFPWMIYLMKSPKSSSDYLSSQTYLCGGSLIHRRVVLTATHCVRGLDKFNIIARAGEWDSTATNEIRPSQDRFVSEIVSHANFNSGGLYNDISLLILAEPFEYAANVDVICLPDREITESNIECVASGWGKDSFGLNGVYQNILKRIELPSVDREKCVSKLRTTILGPKFQLHRSFVCAGGTKGEDTCEGDGGSPLACRLGNSVDIYQLVGIVAWGIGCGNEVPAVYVNVAFFREWIEDEMKKRNLHIEYS